MGRSRKPRGPVRLSPARRLGLYAGALGLWLSGGLWLLFHYFVVHQGPFGPTVDPLEPWWLRIHGAFGFTGIWLFGLLWGVHMTKGWALGKRQWSGSILAGLVIWLIVSGYLLYYVGDEDIRSAVSVLHWALGLAAPAGFAIHRYGMWRRRATTVQPPQSRWDDERVVSLPQRGVGG